MAVKLNQRCRALAGEVASDATNPVWTAPLSPALLRSASSRRANLRPTMGIYVVRYLPEPCPSNAFIEGDRWGTVHSVTFESELLLGRLFRSLIRSI